MSDCFDHECEAWDRRDNGEEEYYTRGGYPPETRESPAAKHLIKSIAGTKIKKGFRWIDQYGEEHCLKSMTTQHVFFSLRMIWNHSAPIEMRIEPYKRYYIRRTVEYLAEAVKHLIVELSTRTDLTPYFEKCLRHMELCLAGHFNPQKRVKTRVDQNK